MRFSWLILRKDGRRLWVPLALWGALITARHVTDWRVATAIAEDGVWIERMKIFASLLSIFEKIVSYVLAGMLVLEDPAIGSTAFWLTRPISGWRMFGVKLLGLVGLSLWPMLVSLPWWLVSGFDETPLAIAVRITGQTLAIGAGMFLAAFLESVNSFFVWSFAAVVMVILTFAVRSGPERFLTTWHQLAFWVCILSMAVLATGTLYRFRRRSFVVVGCLTAAVVAMLLSPT